MCLIFTTGPVIIIPLHYYLALNIYLVCHWIGQNLASTQNFINMDQSIDEENY